MSESRGRSRERLKLPDPHSKHPMKNQVSKAYEGGNRPFPAGKEEFDCQRRNSLSGKSFQPAISVETETNITIVTGF
jgi:hypothetical protein